MTLAQCLVATLRSTAQAYAAGDQVAPCAVLWPDPERLWESVLPELQAMLPELFLLGDYAPEQRTGPALWLRCIEARFVEGAPAAGTAPMFYLPGISREKLRAAEDCPAGTRRPGGVAVSRRDVAACERQGVDALRLSGFQAWRARSRCGQRPSDARCPGWRVTLADDGTD